MYEYGGIRRVHLEVTTQCNASCPQCPRNIGGGRVNPRLPITELRVGDIRRILPAQFVRQLRHITICGNYGDASMAQDLVEICEYFSGVNPRLDLEIHTNGSPRNGMFWTQLASLISRCIFAIDGLEDTNHIYRRNTRWHSIMRNAEAFIGAGGSAEWNFLVFRHNEHQVEVAAALAKDMGFKAFYVKRTSRFFKSGIVRNSVPIMDSDGKVTGALELARSAEFRNAETTALADRHGTREQYETYLQETDITCPAARSQGIYISAEGLVFPCCWMAQIYAPGTVSRRKAQVHRLIKDYGGSIGAINALKRPLEAVLEGEIFRFGIPSGWERGTDRLEVCARQCGKHRIGGAQKAESII